jgi:para-aminobenzoate synthetase component 1
VSLNDQRDRVDTIRLHKKCNEPYEVTLEPRSDKNNLNSSFEMPEKDYVQSVIELQRLMEEGELYETNFCFPFKFRGEIDPVSVYVKLNAFTKAPYNCLLKSGDDFIICGSPELFLKKEGSELRSKPIKGTRPRKNDAVEDQLLKEELSFDLKELTENRMIVDLVRNDLSRIAKVDSVEVEELCKVYSYDTVHQMISTIKCEINNSLGLKEIIEATFPMGSMTGVPKKNAMKLTLELEPFERMFYSGSVADFDKDGDFEMNVIIRSIIYNQKSKELSFSVGSAITLDSDPKKEYEECLLKAEAMKRALNV